MHTVAEPPVAASLEGRAYDDHVQHERSRSVNKRTVFANSLGRQYNCRPNGGAAKNTVSTRSLVMKPTAILS